MVYVFQVVYADVDTEESEESEEEDDDDESGKLSRAGRCCAVVHPCYGRVRHVQDRPAQKNVQDVCGQF